MMTAMMMMTMESVWIWKKDDARNGVDDESNVDDGNSVDDRSNVDDGSGVVLYMTEAA